MIMPRNRCGQDSACCIDEDDDHGDGNDGDDADDDDRRYDNTMIER